MQFAQPASLPTKIEHSTRMAPDTGTSSGTSLRACGDTVGEGTRPQTTAQTSSLLSAVFSFSSDSQRDEVMNPAAWLTKRCHSSSVKVARKTSRSSSHSARLSKASRKRAIKLRLEIFNAFKLHPFRQQALPNHSHHNPNDDDHRCRIQSKDQVSLGETLAQHDVRAQSTSGVPQTDYWKEKSMTAATQKFCYESTDDQRVRNACLSFRSLYRC